MIAVQDQPRTVPLPVMRARVNLAVYHNQNVALWRGAPMDKCASDVLTYQEMIAALRPEIIVETGTWYGGSALFFADMCELVGQGRVLSIDNDPKAPLPSHPRLTYLMGDSADPATLAAADAWAADERGLVLLDSAHTKAHVLAELDAYHHLVAPNGYLVVEDTNINGHPVMPEFGPGPWEAVAEWLPRNRDFETDGNAEPYLTFAPGGYLRRRED